MDCDCCCFTTTDPAADFDANYVFDVVEPIDMPEPNFVVGPTEPFDPIQPVEATFPADTITPTDTVAPTVPFDPFTAKLANDMFIDALNQQDVAMRNLTSPYSPDYTARYDSTTNSTDWYRDGDLSPSTPY